LFETDEIEDFKRLLKEARWSIIVRQYLGHGGLMEITLIREGVGRSTRVILGDVTRFSGPLTGGPFQFELVEASDSAPSRPSFFLRDEKGAIEIEFHSRHVTISAL
jgi:hypothetical protein